MGEDLPALGVLVPLSPHPVPLSLAPPFLLFLLSALVLQCLQEVGSRYQELLVPQSKTRILGTESFTRWLVWGASASTREVGKTECFCIPTTCECIKFNFLNHLVVFECPNHLTLSVPLKLHSFFSKRQFIYPHHLPNFWGKRQKQPLR